MNSVALSLIMTHMITSKDECWDALVGSSVAIKKMYNRTFNLRHKQFHRSSLFRPIQCLCDADWVACSNEGGQTFESFWRNNVAMSHNPSKRPVRPQTSLGFRSSHTQVMAPQTNSNKTIYIQPLGRFPPATDVCNQHAFMVWLQIYCEAFFKPVKIQILPAIEVATVKCDYRVNEITGRFQLNATHIISYLKKNKPNNSHCLIAVTMIDLFPKPSWDFVFGLASANHAVGVFSFARYRDLFYETWTQGKDVLGRMPDGSLDYSPFAETAENSECSDIDGMLLFRACKVMTHEICHMFGMKHCVYHECIMNGSNHLQESDRRPAFLCPICLRKLQAILEFNVIERYKAMRSYATDEFWKKYLYKKATSEKSQSDKTSLWGRRGSLPDVIKTSSLPTANRPKTSRARNHSEKMVVRRPMSGRPKTITTKSATIKAGPTNAIKSTATIIPAIAPPSRGETPPIPPLEAFSDYRKWLDGAIKFLDNEK